MPAHRIGAVPMTPSERQARRRARLRQPDQAPPPAAVRRSLPRPRRWVAALGTLIDLQDDYRAWLDNLPANLEGSRLAQKLPAITEIDLDELQAIDPPGTKLVGVRGFEPPAPAPESSSRGLRRFAATSTGLHKILRYVGFRLTAPAHLC